MLSISGMLAQTSPEFSVNRNYLSIKRDFDESADLRVFKGQITEAEVSSATILLGKVVKEKTSIRFIPLVPFGWNQEYTVAYNNIMDHFVINFPDSYEYLKIEAVYPSGRWVPTNILKWYIKFSRPINETNLYDHIQFTRSPGDTITKAILPLENALVNDHGTLLTLWIEPGRQKRDLIPNKQLGPVFENGKFYGLAILKDLKDNNGVPMQQDFTHIFQTVPPDRKKLDLNSWEVLPPENDRDDLVILFHESMDYGSTMNGLTIINAEKKEITGDWQLIDNESISLFTPKNPWSKGNYKVLLDATIEDLAGNNLNKLFDSKVNDTIPSSRYSSSYFALGFSIE